MTAWEPATEAEAAMWEALRANDQQLYFRVLARTDLFLPVATGQVPAGWGTWTTGGRTHVLAFTSAAAMRACLGDNVGSSRRMPYPDLAVEWPDQEWWLAVNPGLPIEGYLPSWFVAQLSRGDVRLPGRTMGARARLERAETLARARISSPARDTEAVPSTGPPGPTPIMTGPPPPPARPDAISSPGIRPPVEPARAQQVSGAPPPVDPGTKSQRPASAYARPADPTERRPASPWPSTGVEDRPAPENGDRPNRSFFEPVSGRGSAYRDPVTRAGERPVPPSRFAGGSQPFPRRRPPGDPSQDPTEAFGTGVSAAGPADDRRGSSRAPVADPARLQAYAYHPAESEAERTQTLSRRQSSPGPDPAEDLPVSIAEPVSAPPVSRRGFTPVVIEGTIIESRELTEPPTAAVPPEWTVPAPDPEPTVDPYVPPPATNLFATATNLFATAADLFAQAAAASSTPMPVRPVPDPDPAPSVFGPDPARPASGPLTGTGSDQVDPTADPTWAATPLVDAKPAADEVTGAPPVDDFLPANEVEENLLDATGAGSTDTFLSTLLLARVLLPVAPDSTPGSRPGEPGFVWHTDERDGETFVVVYTSPERLADHTDAPVETLPVKFVQLIHRWPDESWSFVVNPGTPVGAKLPGEQIVGLANWAAEVGLGTDAGSEPEPVVVAEPAARTRYAVPAPDPTRPVVMQKAVAPSQLAYYLERGYDRVSGFVHRAGELAHLTTPAELHDALGLGYPGSPFRREAEEIYVLRWPAHRPSLYRIPYGGQNEAAMRAMEGWVIERPPFRGNGFAPGESSDVVAEFKVDSARLPHGAQLWRVGADGTERVVAVLDTDVLLWREVAAGDA